MRPVAWHLPFDSGCKCSLPHQHSLHLCIHPKWQTGVYDKTILPSKAQEEIVYINGGRPKNKTNNER